MPEIEIFIPKSFIADAARILYSDRVYQAVFDTIGLLQNTPELGSKNVPESIIKKYGTAVRKIVVSTFDIFYLYDKGEGRIEIKALVHQRNVY